MKINDTRKKPEVITFGKLEVGDIFIFNDYTLIKVDVNRIADRRWNVVYLSDGKFDYLSNSTPVTPIKTELLIRG